MKLFCRADKLEGQVLPEPSIFTWGKVFQTDYPNGRFDAPVAGKYRGWYLRVLSPFTCTRELLDFATFEKKVQPARYHAMVLVSPYHKTVWYHGWIRAQSSD